MTEKTTYIPIYIHTNKHNSFFFFLPSGAGKVVGLAIAGDDNESDFDVAENGKLRSFLHQTFPSFRECDVAAVLVLDSLHLHLLSPHRQNPNFPRLAVQWEKNLRAKTRKTKYLS